MRNTVLITLFALAAGVAAAQTSPYVSVVGTVTNVDASGHTVAVKTDKTGDTTVKFDERTTFRKMAPGETDTKKATAAEPSDIAAGDRVLARVRTENPTGLPASSVYIMKSAEIAQRNQKTLEEWRTQSVSGRVKSVDDAAKKLVMTVQPPGGAPHDVTLDLSGNVSYERRSPETFNYGDDKLASITPGDNIRVLGTKNADVTEIKAEAIQSDGFKQVSVQIKAVDPATGNITGTDIATKKPVDISIRPNSTMKKLDDQTAAMMARRLNPTMQNGRGAGRDGGGRGPGGPGGGGGRGGMDLNRILEQQPTIQIADLKPGEPIVVLGAPNSDRSKITAMTLVAGVDPILRAAPQNGPDPLGGSWNLGDTGGGGGSQ